MFYGFDSSDSRSEAYVFTTDNKDDDDANSKKKVEEE